MQTRQALTKNAAGLMPGIVFTCCELPAAAPAPAQAQARTAAPGKARAKPASRRREVKVGGKRVKTIDVHAHCVIPEAMALLGLNLADQRGPGIAEVGERRIREMDEQGIDMEALSINPQWYRAERDLVT